MWTSEVKKSASVVQYSLRLYGVQMDGGRNGRRNVNAPWREITIISRESNKGLLCKRSRLILSAIVVTE